MAVVSQPDSSSGLGFLALPRWWAKTSAMLPFPDRRGKNSLRLFNGFVLFLCFLFLFFQIINLINLDFKVFKSINWLFR